MNRVREERLRKGLSQEELSRLSRVPRTTISAIESGKVIPSVEHAIKISRALGCKVEELFGEEETPLLFEDFKEGAFVSARVNGREVLYPVSPEFFPADGYYKEGRIERFRGYVPTYIFAGCDVSVRMLSYELAKEGIRFLPIYSSSEKALRLLKEGYIHLAGIHLGSFEENLRRAKEYLGKGYTILRVFSWEEGIITRRGIINELKDLKNRRLLWLVREKGSGSRLVFEQLAKELRNYKTKEITGGHRELAYSIKNGFGDAGIGVKLFAQQEGLEFFSLKREDYCICYKSELEDDEDFLKVLFAFTRRSYREVLKTLPGYYADMSFEKQTV